MVEEGIALGRSLMEEMLSAYKADPATATEIREQAVAIDPEPGNGNGGAPRTSDAPALNEAGLHAKLMSESTDDTVN